MAFELESRCKKCGHYRQQMCNYYFDTGVTRGLDPSECIFYKDKVVSKTPKEKADIMKLVDRVI